MSGEDESLAMGAVNQFAGGVSAGGHLGVDFLVATGALTVGDGHHGIGIVAHQMIEMGQDRPRQFVAEFIDLLIESCEIARIALGLDDGLRLPHEGQFLQLKQQCQITIHMIIQKPGIPPSQFIMRSGPTNHKNSVRLAAQLDYR